MKDESDALRVWALYERLGQENRLLLELLQAGYSLAEAEERLAERMRDEGGRMDGSSLFPSPRGKRTRGEGRWPRQGARRVVI